MPDPVKQPKSQPFYPDITGLSAVPLPPSVSLPKPVELAKAALGDSPIADILLNHKYPRTAPEAVNQLRAALPKLEMETPLGQDGKIGAFYDPADNTRAVYAGSRLGIQNDHMVGGFDWFAINRLDSKGTDFAATLGVQGNGSAVFLRGGIFAEIGEENRLAGAVGVSGILGGIFGTYSTESGLGAIYQKSIPIGKPDGPIASVLDIQLRYGAGEPGQKPAPSLKIDFKLLGK